MASARSVADVFSHWFQWLDGLQASPQEFYAAVESAAQARQIPDAHVARVRFREGGPLSAKREYLRVMRREHIFDICGAPFGRGFFVSWWLGEVPSGCLMILAPIPFLGAIAGHLIRRPTYHRIDTALMFQEAIHEAVLEVVDQLTTAKGIRGVSGAERKPVMRGFFGR